MGKHGMVCVAGLEELLQARNDLLAGLLSRLGGATLPLHLGAATF